MNPGQLFRDRLEAGAALGDRLASYRGRDALVIGIPRGGMIVAAEVARSLEAELDFVIARKMGAPGQEELAIGAVTADGRRFLNESVIASLAVSEPYIRAITSVQMAKARSREKWLRSFRPRAPVAGRTVIVVDEGLATGATMRASIRSLQARRPARLVVAVPVGAREACVAVQHEVNEIVCLNQPEPFVAIGTYYQHFDAVEDADVRQLLVGAVANQQAATLERTGTALETAGKVVVIAGVAAEVAADELR